MTKLVSMTDLRADMEMYFDAVEAEGSPLVVTRGDGTPLIVARLIDWEGMEETLHLLSTPANARNLRASIAELDAGKGVERDLIAE